MIHHDFDQHRHDIRQNGGAIAQLVAVYRTIPGRATVQELVSQRVESRKHDTQHRAHVLAGHGGVGRSVRFPEPIFPVGVVGQPVLVVPVGLEDVLIVQENPNGARIPAPDQLGQARLGVERGQPVEKTGKPLRLDHALRPDVGRIGRVEGHPEKDEAPIRVIAPLGPVQPAQRPMDAQGQKLWPAVAFGALARFQ